MGDTFDPYREALVVEHSTVWPAELAQLDPQTRQRIETELHTKPAEARQLEYLRLPTGFHRRITVTAEDIERLR